MASELRSMKMELSSWGRYPQNSLGEIFQPLSPREIAEVLESSRLNPDFSFIPRGLGRSYGDAALPPQSSPSAQASQVVSLLSLNAMLNFDEKTGELICESGVSLKEIIEVFLPRGWMLPVTPGTQYVTVGGAIASDVHGKNHHGAGSFSEYVSGFELMLPSGEIVRCSREENAEFFLATCGGMGLTGIILRVGLILWPVQSPYIACEYKMGGSLHEVLGHLRENAEATYSVAWIDSTATKANLGRGIVMLGEHTRGLEDLKDFKPKAQRSLPGAFPEFVLNPYSIKAFNNFYYQTKRLKAYLRNNKNFIESWEQYFYPLDGLSNWNLCYGKRGFLQYQFVAPFDSAEALISRILTHVAAETPGSWVSVLKLLGEENSNWLSFAKKGVTLALDLPYSKNLLSLLDRFDDWVIEAGGRVYLTKDARLSEKSFKAMYPNWEVFGALREKIGAKEKIHSGLSRRLGI
jgi:decaprenylphospho-beta-D-ribofuranose 2-oxidase